MLSAYFSSVNRISRDMAECYQTVTMVCNFPYRHIQNKLYNIIIMNLLKKIRIILLLVTVILYQSLILKRIFHPLTLLITLQLIIFFIELKKSFIRHNNISSISHIY